MMARPDLNISGGRADRRKGKRKGYRAGIDTVSPGLSAFSRQLSAADFRAEFDAAAAQVGIAPPPRYVLNGDWQYAKAIEPSYRHKVGYIGEWRVSRHGVRYPVVTFRTFKHGGVSAVCNGYRTVIERWRRDYVPPRRAISLAESPPTHQPPDKPVQLAKLNRLWVSAFPLDHRQAEPARRYLQARGLGELLNDPSERLRCHPHLPYWEQVEDKPQLIGYFPALLAQVTDVCDTIVSIHRTFLALDGNGKAPVSAPKKLMFPIRQGALTGAAIRLYPAESALALAEGIETALAIRAALGMPVWATVSAHGLRTVELPETVQDLLICADNDVSRTGQKAARALATRLLRQGIQVRIITPPVPGTDWLDVLQGGSDDE